MLDDLDHEGEVAIDGTAVTAKSAGGLKAFRRDVQIVFQDPFGALSPRISVGDIIAEGLVAHDIGTAEERGRAVAEVLREVPNIIPQKRLQPLLEACVVRVRRSAE